MANIGYLIAAYLVFWLGLFIYLLWMGGTVRGLRAELSELRSEVQERERRMGTEEASAPPPAKAGRTP